jgi:hypothetical protein
MSGNRYPITLRLTKFQVQVADDLAARLGLPAYQARLRIFERGLTEITGEQTRLVDTATLDLLAEILARLEFVERLAERTLYTAASAYTFAAHAAHKGGTNPTQLNETLSQASMDAYRRQLEAARAQK